MSKKATKKTGNEIYIHIKAVSEVYSFNGIIEEQKAVRVLEGIRDDFKKLKSKYSYNNSKVVTDTLVVNTCVHNPTLL